MNAVQDACPEMKLPSFSDAPLHVGSLHREESMDAVLCGEVPAAFHDEAMVLYYLNHELINFGAGKYVPRVGNCDTERNPHEEKAWGKGRNYQWGEADSDNKGGKACALTFTGASEETDLCLARGCCVRRRLFLASSLVLNASSFVAGEIFHTAGYGLAFGRDSTAFVPWSRIIAELKEEHVIAKMMDASNERDFGIGESGIQKFRTRCGESSISDKFILNDFIGLYIILASFLWAGFIAHFTEVRFFHKPIDPFDNDLGQSFKMLEQDSEKGNPAKKRARSVEDIEEKLEEMRSKQEHSKVTLQRILQTVRQWQMDDSGPGMYGPPGQKMIEAAPSEGMMIESEGDEQKKGEDSEAIAETGIVARGSFKADPDEVE